MRHEEARERLLELEYGELAPAEARDLEAHLRECDACRAEREAMAGTRRAMRRLAPEAPAPGGERILAAAAREAAGRREAERSRRAGFLRLAATAAAVLAVGGVSWRLLAGRVPADRDLLGDGAPVATRPAGGPVGTAPPRAGPAAAPAPGGEEGAAAPAAAPAERAAPAAPSRRAPVAAAPSQAAPAAPAPAAGGRAPGPAEAVAPASAEAHAPAGVRAPEAKAAGREEAGLRSGPPAARPADEERTVACAGGTLRVRAWRDESGRIRRVVRQLASPGGVRTVVLAWDEGGRRTEARVEAPGPGGAAAPAPAELSPDPETAIADPRCP